MLWEEFSEYFASVKGLIVLLQMKTWISRITISFLAFNFLSFTFSKDAWETTENIQEIHLSEDMRAV